MANFHQSVLLDEAVDALNINPTGVYVDGTFGRGGHSGQILEKLGTDGRLIATDKDQSAIAYGQAHLADERLTLICASFADLSDHLKNIDLLGKVDGVLLDLGVSSPQFDQAERGFSFAKDGPLDMRMNQQNPLTAKAWLQSASEEEIADVLWQYGQERKSRRIARAIVQKRADAPLETTADLASCIAKVVKKSGKKHPATRSFQAVRIFINQEIDELKTLLGDMQHILKIGGRLVVISFHSLEDTEVKRFFKPVVPFIPKEIPMPTTRIKQMFKPLGKRKPTDAEVSHNPRARSAVMRVGQRLA